MSVKTLGGGLPLVVRAVLAMSKDTVEVGVPADSPRRQEKDAPPNAVIAYIMETGSPAHHIPPRPFLGPGIENAKPQVVAEMRAAAVQALKDVAALRATAQSGSAVQKGLERTGKVAQASVRKKMLDGPFIPLAGKTIAKRQKEGRFWEDPLIDTTQLYEAVTYRVVPKKR